MTEMARRCFNVFEVGVAPGEFCDRYRDGLTAGNVTEGREREMVAQLGMDLAMATLIMNKLDHQLNMGLPLNTCHTHVDLVSLTKTEGPPSARPSTDLTRPSASHLLIRTCHSHRAQTAIHRSVYSSYTSAVS